MHYFSIFKNHCFSFICIVIMVSIFLAFWFFSRKTNFKPFFAKFLPFLRIFQSSTLSKPRFLKTKSITKYSRYDFSADARWRELTFFPWSDSTVKMVGIIVDIHYLKIVLKKQTEHFFVEIVEKFLKYHPRIFSQNEIAQWKTLTKYEIIELYIYK